MFTGRTCSAKRPILDIILVSLTTEVAGDIHYAEDQDKKETCSA